MRMVDLSHRMNVHTPGWVGYAGNKMYYAQNLQTVSIVAQRIDTALHVGTHIDGAMHASDGMGDMASYSLDFLVGKGAIVDVSAHVGDWDVITPAMLEAAPGRDRAGRHPDDPHRLPPLLRGPAAAGPGALLLHAPGRQARAARVDAGQKNPLVRDRLRLGRPPDQHHHPLHAPRPHQDVRGEGGDGVRRILSALRVHPQALRPPGAQQPLPVPQLRLSGRPDPRRERRRRHRDGAEPALHHRRLSLEIRRAGSLPVPDHRVLRLRRCRGRSARWRAGLDP